MSGGTTEVRSAFAIDRLEAWMRDTIEAYAGPLQVTQFAGGQSNPTYKLATPDRVYVMRRKPTGQLLKGAHAVDREARVISALHKIGFPVPLVYGLCTDESVIGTSFYVMEMLDGRVFWDGRLSEVPRRERPRYYDAMNAVIARLHQTDYEAIGLGDFGRSGNYLERQIARWKRQYLSDAEVAGREAGLDRLIEWLPANIPDTDETTLVHGDFRIDNMVFHPTEPMVVGVLDWELSTLGNPLADFAYHLMVWRLPHELVAGLMNSDLGAHNIPSESAYVEAYCRRTGRTDIHDLEFYVTFGMFRFAAIIHGIKARHMRGTASSADSERLIALLPTASGVAAAQIPRA